MGSFKVFNRGSKKKEKEKEKKVPGMEKPLRPGIPDILLNSVKLIDRHALIRPPGFE